MPESPDVSIGHGRVALHARCYRRKIKDGKDKLLWGGEFWTDGYFASTVGKHGNEDMIGKYVKEQGGTYQKLHGDYQLALF